MDAIEQWAQRFDLGSQLGNDVKRTSMIKLCIVSTASTTIKAFFGEQLEFLQNNGFDITVITSSAISLQDFGENFPDSIKFYTVKMSGTMNLLDDIKAFRKISKLIKQGNFDKIYFCKQFKRKKFE